MPAEIKCSAYMVQTKNVPARSKQCLLFLLTLWKQSRLKHFFWYANNVEQEFLMVPHSRLSLGTQIV